MGPGWLDDAQALLAGETGTINSQDQAEMAHAPRAGGPGSRQQAPRGRGSTSMATGKATLAGHGGEQRAVPVYQMDSYRYSAPIDPLGFCYGQFGENFTVDGLAHPVMHCASNERARQIRDATAVRLAEVGLELHPDKAGRPARTLKIPFNHQPGAAMT